MTKIKKQRRVKCQNAVTECISGGGQSSLSSPGVNEGVNGLNTTCHPERKRRISKAFTLAEVFSRHSDGQRRSAFTLAEVLITLGIIGVVAAMTLPTLIQNHKKHVVETRLAKFYSTINQAIKRSEVDNGDKKYWDTLGNGYETGEDGEPDLTKPLPIKWFDKYLRPYLNLAKVGIPETREAKVEAYFTDGSLVLISSSSFVFFPDAKDYEKIYVEDTGELNFNRSFGGTKMFTFFFYPDRGVEPFHYMVSEYALRNLTNQACKKDALSSERARCAALIQKNGWKIPKDYPLKF